MKLKVGIIDDEIHAIQTLTFDLNDIFEDSVEIVFSTINPVNGLKEIRNKKPDLLFLDMDMPQLSGIEVLNLIEDLKLSVIITTAHEEYAVNSVGTNAVAYLLKPVQPELLKPVVEKVINSLNTKNSLEVSSGKISVPVFDGFEILEYNEIVFCKSDNNYTEFILTDNRKVVVSKTLKYIEDSLPGNIFFRVHKSYLVNINHIKKYIKSDGGELLLSNKKLIPVSRTQRDDLLKLIQNNFLP